MFEIVDRKVLNPDVTWIKVKAPFVARKAQPGQFIILRVDKDGERVPFTISEYDRNEGTVGIIFKVVGASTRKLNEKKVGDYIEDFVGPLGQATEVEGYKNVIVVGGGVGCAIAYPVSKKLHDLSANVSAIIGFANKDYVFYEDEFSSISSNLTVMTDDGSYGEKGFVDVGLRRLLESGETYDLVFCVGPLKMMKAVCEITKEYGIKTIASMNPIMIDGTGMCGGCRLTVGGEVKFACVDGPDFDGHEVDFDEAISRTYTYSEFERHAYEKTCNLFSKEVEDA